MDETRPTFPALTERALRLIIQRGEPIFEDELITALFGATTGPWSLLLAQSLSGEQQITKLPDGRWTLTGACYEPTGACREPQSIRHESALREESSAYQSVDSTFPQSPVVEPADVLSDGGRQVGLVVLANGPKPWRHPILAIGAARHGTGDRIEQFELFVRPDRRMRIPAYLARFGINSELNEDASGLEYVLDELEAFCGDAALVGVDIALAVAHLQFALRALGRRPLTNPMIELAVATVQRPDLERLARARGLAYPARPRPASLATLALRLASRQTDEHLNSPSENDEPLPSDSRPIGAVSALRATDGRILLDDSQLSSVPEGPGIYLFLGPDARVLYVGKATSLRQRLASYLNGNFRITRQMSGIIDGTVRLNWEVQACELAARAREAEMIATHCPPYNVQREALILARTDLVLASKSQSTAAPVPRLARDTSGGPVMTTRSAAREALFAARQEWWPSRPRRADRPDAMLIAERFGRLRTQFWAACRAALIGPELTCGNLDLLLVVAPVTRRIVRPPLDAREHRSEDDRWWLAEVDDDRDASVEAPESKLDSSFWLYSDLDNHSTSGSTDESGAFLVSPGGVGTSVQLGGLPQDAASDQIREIAISAIGSIPNVAAQATNGGLAALNTVARAYLRGEEGLLIFPIAVEPRNLGEMTTAIDSAVQQPRFDLPEG